MGWIGILYDVLPVSCFLCGYEGSFKGWMKAVA